jgi:hypothetical protein
MRSKVTALRKDRQGGPAEKEFFAYIMEVAHKAFASADRAKVVADMYQVNMPFLIAPLSIAVLMSEDDQLEFFEHIVGQVEYERIREAIYRVRPVADYFKIPLEVAWDVLKDAAAIELVNKYPEAAARARIGDIVTAGGEWHDSDWFYPEDFYVLMQHGVALGESKRSGYTGDSMGDAAHDLNALAANLGLSFEEAAAKLTAAARASSDPLSRARRVVRSFERHQHKNPDLPASPEVVEARRFVNRANYRGGKGKTSTP